MAHIDSADYDVHKTTRVEDLSDGDIIDLDGDTAWDEDRLGELEDASAIEVLDVYLDEDDEGEEVWRVWIEGDRLINVPPGYEFSRLVSGDEI